MTSQIGIISGSDPDPEIVLSIEVSKFLGMNP
jgi:hypothetical protein